LRLAAAYGGRPRAAAGAKRSEKEEKAAAANQEVISRRSLCRAMLEPAKSLQDLKRKRSD
jgi:hypothetical protein